jgi:nitrate reductase gamma subunit
MDGLLFGAFPYVAITIFVIGTIYRYKVGFKYSSLSSQFLESKSFSMGSVPFHVGILVVFLAHLIAFIFPSFSFGGSALVTMETIMLAFSILAVVGLSILFYRRMTNERVRMVTNNMDIAIEVLLLAQFVIGIFIAVSLKWGSAWYASDMVPYLWSIFTFSPDVAAVAATPFLIKFHIVAAFAIILLIPFSRLVHFLVAPLHYITRPYQVVRWNWDKKKIRDPEQPWEDVIQRPKNN